MVGFRVVGVGLVSALQALLGLVGAVVAVACRHAPGMLVGGQELVRVRVLPPTHIRGLPFSFP